MKRPTQKYLFWCIGLGIVSLSGSLGRAAAPVSIESIANWQFAPSDDVNYDGWPDQWRRRAGSGYPAYLNIRIVPYSGELQRQARQADVEMLGFWRLLEPLGWPASELPMSWTSLFEDYLRIEMNGGAAWLESPKFPVSSNFSYHLHLRQMTEGLKRDQAWSELVFYGVDDRELLTVQSNKLSGDQLWRTVTIGPVATPPQATTIAIRLRVEADSRPDICGAIGFDQIDLRRSPQLTLANEEPSGLYSQSAVPRIVCRLSGLSSQGADLQVTLHDAMGKVLITETTPVELGKVANDGFHSGTVHWQPGVNSPGWYSVAARLVGADLATMEGSVAFAMLGTMPPASDSPFGISLPQKFGMIPVQKQPAWLSEMRMGWVKYPCWLAPDDRKASDEMAWLMERLSQRGIRSVCVLSQPPEVLRSRFPGTGTLPATMLFREQELWQPMLETQMSRLSLRVGWWQIGSDDDFSFSKHPNPSTFLTDIRNGLQGFGQPVSVVTSWPLLDPQAPKSPSPGWNAVSISDPLPTTASEIGRLIESKKSSPRQTWIVLDPLPKSQYDLVTRVRDLVERMIAIRQDETISAAFCARPMNPDQGLLSPDGSPTEMLLPWRTTSGLIGHLTQIGSLQLPNKSQNMMLGKGEEGVLVVWNEFPIEESAHLGDNVQQYDVWGFNQSLKKSADGRQLFTAGPWPTFLTGVDTKLMRWRMGISIEPNRLDSLLGRRQTVEVVIRNPSKQLASGQLRPLAPEAWQVELRNPSFSIAPGATVRIPIDIVMGTNANIGTNELGLEFTIEAERQLRFVASREVSVGPIDLEMDIATTLDAKGRLIVQQEFINKGVKDYRLDCYLFLPGRQRDRTPYLIIPAGDRVLKKYTIEDGEELVGKKLLMTIEEINSERRMNYRADITR